jgi:AraC-like DNA-binding protein
MQSITMQPIAALRSFVREIIVIDKQTIDGVITPIPFYADGLPGVVFQQSAGHMYLDDNTKRLSTLFLYGQTIRPISLLPNGSFRIIVFLLFPLSITGLFGIPANQVTDNCVDLRLLPGASLDADYNKLVEAEDTAEQIAIISKYLLAKAAKVPARKDSLVHYALEHIIASKGQSSLPEIRERLCITERTFQRRFEQYVGVSPRLFSRICQFQSTVRQMDRQQFNKLSDVAYRNGFADQSHFIRSFRQFTGTSPLQYLRKSGI